MEIFNASIRALPELLGMQPDGRWAFSSQEAWPDAGKNELVMQREAAFELGGSGQSAVSFSCFTTDDSLVAPDEVLLYGPDINQIRADSPFGRIVLFSTQDVGEEDEAFRALQEIDFARYHVHPEGYMIRALSEENREQVRVSKAAAEKGISFRTVGFDYIRKFKENENVRSVKVIFVTDPKADFKALIQEAKKVSQIQRSLCTILEGIPTDCDSCGLREICDEVEGMRELHFSQANNAKGEE